MAQLAYALPNGFVLDNRFVIQEGIASGGFGITYKAYDRKNNEVVAVKELFPKQLVVRCSDGVSVASSNPAEADQFYHCKEKFVEEAMALYNLKDNPCVVDVSDYFEQNGTSYFVMEYLDGYNLRQLAKINGGSLKLENLIPIIRQAAGALQEVHRSKLFHRDISPDNIFWTKQGRTVLIDFGNAKVLANFNNEGLSVFLKPGFAPLEQYSSKKPQGTYTDVYSFAATIYFLLTGKKIPQPYDRINGEDYQRLKDYGFTTAFSDGIDRALVQDYKRRTQTIDQFMRDIGLGPNPPVIPTPPLPPPDERVIIDVYTDAGVQAYILPPNRTLKIGRAPDFCNIPINIGYVSGIHFEIMYDDISKELYATDCNSTNGTYIGSTYAQMRKNTIMVIPFDTDIYLGGMGCKIRVRRG